MEEHYGNYSNNSSLSELKNLNLSRCITALVCAIGLVVVLVALCSTKAYKTRSHRIFVYLMFATLAVEVSFSANLILQAYFHLHSDEDNFKGVCTILGALVHWSSLSYVFSAAGSIVYVIGLMCIILKYPQWLSGNRKSCCHGFSTRELMEILYVCIIMLLPLAFVLAPVVNRNYELVIAWCWVQSGDSTRGIVEQIVYGYGYYEGLGVLCLVALVLFSIMYCKLPLENTQAKQLLIRSSIMTMFILFYIFYTTAALSVYLIYDQKHYNSSVIMEVQAFGIPVGTLIIPLGYLCSFYYGHFYRICCKGAIKRRQYERLEGRRATCPQSDRVSQRSDTFFETPHTNAFTSSV